MPMLSDYLTATMRLLHDSTNAYWSISELTNYINQARNRLVRDTGCYRVLQVGAISAGQEAYSFNTGGVTGVSVLSSNNLFASTPSVNFTGGGGTGAAATAIMGGTAPNLTISSIVMTASGTGYTSPPAVSFTGAGTATAAAGIIALGTFDILNVTLQWGSVRVPMDYMPYTQFNRNVRGLMQYTQRPTVFSTYGQNTVYLGPVPDQTYIVEWEPPASVTRSSTVWAPEVEKDVESADSPGPKTPLPAVAQAKAVIGLPASVEVDTSVIASPVCGAEGIHLNDAAGSMSG